MYNISKLVVMFSLFFLPSPVCGWASGGTVWTSSQTVCVAIDLQQFRKGMRFKFLKMKTFFFCKLKNLKACQASGDEATSGKEETCWMLVVCLVPLHSPAGFHLSTRGQGCPHKPDRAEKMVTVCRPTDGMCVVCSLTSKGPNSQQCRTQTQVIAKHVRDQNFLHEQTTRPGRAVSLTVFYWKRTSRTQAMLPALEAILGHRSAHSLATGPVMAEPVNTDKETLL